MFNYTKYSTQPLVSFGLALCLAACSDSDDGSSPRDGEGASVSATVDATTAQLALQELTTNIDATVTGFKGANPAAPSQVATAGSAGAQNAINMRCSAGGEANVGGYVNVVPVPVLVDVKVAIQYNGCATNTGTTIAGDIDFSQTVAAGPGTPLRVETIYQGDVVFSGKVNATCPVDLNVLVDETGRAVQVGGTFCGQDAAALSIQVAPRWSPAN